MVLGGRVRGDRLSLDFHLMEFEGMLEEAFPHKPMRLSQQRVESEEGAELVFRLSCGLE